MSDAISSEAVRAPAVAYAFYPGDPRRLENDIISFLNATTSPRIEGDIVALISPHAGYMYSGQVAAEGYKQVQGKDYQSVAIIAPSHREHVTGVSVFTGQAYQTPLGLVPVDRELAEHLVAQDGRIMSSWAGHREEHSLEVQLPFLQIVLKDFSIVPIVMGQHNYETCTMLGEKLADVVQDKNVLIVASTDLSHFYPYPRAVVLDRVIIERVNSFNYQGLADDLDNGVCEACGGGPMVAAMVASARLGADKSQVLLYKNSGDVTGDRTEVVGYLSAALYRVASLK